MLLDMTDAIASNRRHRVRPLIGYHNSFNPNCIWRGEFACDVITPNDDDVTVVFGPLKRGVLKALRASTRN